jgi:hypothetical protein
MRLLALISEAPPIERILRPIGEPPEPPPIAPTRAPPAWDDLLAPLPDWDAPAQTTPKFEFDQRISW